MQLRWERLSNPEHRTVAPGAEADEARPEDFRALNRALEQRFLLLVGVVVLAAGLGSRQVAFVQGSIEDRELHRVFIEQRLSSPAILEARLRYISVPQVSYLNPTEAEFPKEFECGLEV